MKTELRNVLLTFFLIGVVSLGVSKIYTHQETQLVLAQETLERTLVETDIDLTKISAAREAEQMETMRIQENEVVTKKLAEEELQREKEAQALAAAKNAAEAQAIKEAGLAAEAARLAADKQAAAEAKRQADLLAAKQAAADMAALKAAEKKAADLAAAQASAKQSTRRSRAS